MSWSAVLRWTDGRANYFICRRCGETFEVPIDSVASFCRDCRHPSLIGVFRMLDYSKILNESEAA